VRTRAPGRPHTCVSVRGRRGELSRSRLVGLRGSTEACTPSRPHTRGRVRGPAGRGNRLPGSRRPRGFRKTGSKASAGRFTPIGCGSRFRGRRPRPGVRLSVLATCRRSLPGAHLQRLPFQYFRVGLKRLEHNSADRLGRARRHLRPRPSGAGPPAGPVGTPWRDGLHVRPIRLSRTRDPRLPLDLARHTRASSPAHPRVYARGGPGRTVIEAQGCGGGGLPCSARCRSEPIRTRVSTAGPAPGRRAAATAVRVS
jgi:hypothetical protein